MPKRKGRATPEAPALFFKLDRKKPLAQQICGRVRAAIMERRLLAGERLASVRGFAQTLEVSVDTVLAAYRSLADEGFIVPRRGAGFFVCDLGAAEGLIRPPGHERRSAPHSASEPGGPQPLNSARQPSEEILRRTEHARRSVVAEYRSAVRSPLQTYASGMECIAEKHYLRFAAQLARSPWLHSSYSDPQGYLPLRHAVCRRLRRSQGISIDPARVVITTGLVQGLSLLAEVLFSPSDVVWVENPGYPTVWETLEYRGLTAAAVPTDAEGINVRQALAQAPNARGVFVSTASQYPLGAALSEARGAELLDWAQRTGGWIVEDGTDGAISLGGRPYRSLFQASGAAECVAYVESFSLLIAPGIRAGYIVLPEAFAEVCAAAKYLTDRTTNESTQALLAEFLDSDVYESFWRRFNRRYRQRYDALCAAVHERLAPFGALLPAEYGCHAAFVLKSPISDAALSGALAGEGIRVRPLSMCCRDEVNVRGLLLGFGTTGEEQIREAVGRIAAHCERLARAHSSGR